MIKCRGISRFGMHGVAVMLPSLRFVFVCKQMLSASQLQGPHLAES